MVVKFEELTERESEVVTLALQGLSDKEIAEALYVSDSTVKTHLINTFRKLKCKKGRIDLFVKAIERLKDESKSY